jgi:hypothetical protein
MKILFSARPNSCYFMITLASRLRSDTSQRESVMATNQTSQAAPMRFESMPQADVPKGRDGKHKPIVEELLNDLGQLQEGNALKIPLSALPDSKENIRSALSRATKQREIEIATSSDEDFLYVWKPKRELTEDSNGHGKVHSQSH